MEEVIVSDVPEKKKRGRKAKDKTQENNEENPIEKIPKKRGRKPKGGKIVTIQSNNNTNNDFSRVNIILHLKCNTSDIKNSVNNVKTNIDNFQFSENKTNELNYMIYNTKQEVINDIDNKSNISNNKINNMDSTDCIECDDNIINNVTTHNNVTVESNENKENNDSMKNIWYKLEKLSKNLHINNICNKKSACFNCTCDFDNTPIYIPKYELNKTYYVYGCFCSPECACAHLMNDKSIDNTCRFERYQLLNYIYCKIYNYNKNIKPAPCPYYMLDKFYGNLSIQEYRKLLKNERLLLIVEKPLIKIMPEIHEDGDDYLLNSQDKSTSSLNKYSIQKNVKSKSKNDILNDQFNVR